MNWTTNLMLMGAVAGLLMSGALFALIPPDMGDSPPVMMGASADNTILDLQVHIICQIDGKDITFTGVSIVLYSEDVNDEINQTMGLPEKVAEAQTDANGNTVFHIPKGEYIVTASYQGLTGSIEANMTDDQMVVIELRG